MVLSWQTDGQHSWKELGSWTLLTDFESDLSLCALLLSTYKMKFGQVIFQMTFYPHLSPLEREEN